MTQGRLSGREIEPPPFPAHLEHYLPGRMKLTDLEPNVYWATDLIDLHLGGACQKAFRDGQEMAHEAHKATEAMTERRMQMMKGRAQC